MIICLEWTSSRNNIYGFSIEDERLKHAFFCLNLWANIFSSKSLEINTNNRNEKQTTKIEQKIQMDCTSGNGLMLWHNWTNIDAKIKVKKSAFDWNCKFVARELDLSYVCIVFVCFTYSYIKIWKASNCIRMRVWRISKKCECARLFVQFTRAHLHFANVK